MGELRWVSSTGGSVALDDRTYPVVFATWIGSADATTLRGFFDWNTEILRRATREKRVFSMITDATRANRPDAAARAMIAELTKDMQVKHADSDAYRVVGPVVVDNPLVRGALTAVGWIMGTNFETEYADSCASAITIVQKRFVARGAPWPAELTPTGYTPARR
jgi:hypothetical protein